MDDTVYGLLVALNTTCASRRIRRRTFFRFSRDRAPMTKNSSGQGNKQHRMVVDYALQTLSKFDQVRIFLTTNDGISNKLPNKMRTRAVAPRLNNLRCIYLFSTICSKQGAQRLSGSAQSAA